MATEVVLPMLGITIEKGKILKWFKSEGAFVKKGEPIFEVETDKVVTEIGHLLQEYWKKFSFLWI
jgi:pyruvate dehydrogenase E2 component (dihydrolipoamide acetyltransferase)